MKRKLEQNSNNNNNNNNYNDNNNNNSNDTNNNVNQTRYIGSINRKNTQVEPRKSKLVLAKRMNQRLILLSPTKGIKV
jgi:hypothetical protein